MLLQKHRHTHIHTKKSVLEFFLIIILISMEKKSNQTHISNQNKILIFLRVTNKKKGAHKIHKSVKTLTEKRKKKI